jgi:hypothetical protein
MPQGIPQQTAMVRKVRTQIFHYKDYIMRCPDSQSALNGWRLLCEFEYGIIMDMTKRNKLPPNEPSMDWDKYVKDLEKEYDHLKTSQKTEIEISREGEFEFYSVQWDTYVGKFAPREFDRGVQIMDNEKYDSVCHDLMKLVGKFEFILFSCDALNLNDDIEVPLPMDSYSNEQLQAGIQSRKVRKREATDQTRQR